MKRGNPDAEPMVIGTYTVHPLRRYVPESSGEVYERLKASIEQNGLMTRIVVDPDGLIIDGRARTRACVELGIEDAMGVPETYRTGNIAAFIAASVIRADYTSAQRAILAAHLMEPFRIASAERQKYAKTTHAADEAIKGESAKQVAALVGNTNSTYVRAAEKLLEDADDIVALINEGVIRTIPRRNQSTSSPAAIAKTSSPLCEKIRR